MKSGFRKKTAYCLTFFLTVCISTAVARLYGRDLSELIRVAVSAGIGAGTMLFIREDYAAAGRLSWDNGTHPGRFLYAYLASFALILFLPMIVADAWPFLSIYVLLSLMSCPFLGAFAGTMLLMLTILIQGSGTAEFFMYVFTGFIALALFSGLDEEVRAGLPLFIALLMQTVLLVCYHVMFLNESLSPGVLIVPLISVFINFALMIIILNAFSFHVVRRDAERYEEINDPAYALMRRLRESNETEYQRAIHTDYLTQRISDTLGLNRRAVRSCSYYHRAAVVLPDRDMDKTIALYREHHFPEEAIRLLQEVLTHKKGEALSAEATVVLLCDTMIASLQFMFQKNKQTKVDYAALVDKIFERKEADGEFKESSLSLRGLAMTRELLKKETLYYDFLR